MSSPHRLFLLALAVIGVLLRQPTNVASQETCVTQAKTFPSNRAYANCTDLPYLSATLHYTYNHANSSLDIAYVAAPAPGGAWIAWAINPTSTGMAGSQALIALKPTGGSTVVAKTFNISSYSSIVESPLSFSVWGLTADEVNGTMRLFGSVKVPGSAASLNQVWQIGGAVNGTQPRIHPLSTDNKESLGTLELASSTAPAPSPRGTVTTAPAPSPSGTVATTTAPASAPAKSEGTRVGLSFWIVGCVVFGLAF